MKTLLLLFFSSMMCVFISFKEESISIPGASKINDTLWYDQHEVTNGDYMEFLKWVGKTYGYDSRQYQKALPDTLVWRSKLSYNEPYVKYYFRHPAYTQYPVVGISWYQANDYCVWRTLAVKERLAKKSKGKTFVFDFRLPTKAEWQAVSLLGWNKQSEQQFKKGKLDKRTPWNFKYGMGDKAGIAGTLKDAADITRPVFSGPANEKNIYNLFGNVAEMVNETGICVGGGWFHGPDESAFEKTIEYVRPESWLGFRCVCIVKNP